MDSSQKGLIAVLIGYVAGVIVEPSVVPVIMSTILMGVAGVIVVFRT